MSECRPQANIGKSRYGVESDIRTYKKSWNWRLVETSYPNPLLASQWAKKKTRSPCDGPAFGPPSTTPHTTLTGSLCSSFASLPVLPGHRKHTSRQRLLDLVVLLPRMLLSQIYNVSQTRSFQVLAVKSVLQKGLSPLYYK